MHAGAFCSPDPGFSDVPPDHPFYGEISWASEHGIIGGYADGTFRPGGLVTRQALVSYPDGTFRAGGSVTRQAAAAFIHRWNDEKFATVGCPIVEP
jgi:hypothetical protein